MITLEENHVYKHDGKEYPSVTQIIQEAGLKPEPFGDTSYYTGLGTVIHKLIELYDKDDLGEFNTAYMPYLGAWIGFKKYYPDLDETILDIKTGQKYKWHPIQTAGYQILYEFSRPKGNLIEVRLCNLIYGFAGTVDRIYSSTGEIKNRMAVYINPEGYKVEKHDNIGDEEVFKAALILHNWKTTRQKKCK